MLSLPLYYRILVKKLDFLNPLVREVGVVIEGIYCWIWSTATTFSKVKHSTDGKLPFQQVPSFCKSYSKVVTEFPSDSLIS